MLKLSDEILLGVTVIGLILSGIVLTRQIRRGTLLVP